MARFTLISMLLLLTVIPVSAGDFSLEVGLDIATGDYGTDENLTAITVPVTLRYMAEGYSLALGFPWVSQSKGTTVFMGGRRFGNGMSGSSMAAGTGGGMMGGGSSANGVNTGDSNTGLGDATLDAELRVWRPQFGPALSLLGYLKTPTGDDDKGLGTGAWDFGAGFAARQEFGNWFLDGSLRAIFPGDNGAFQPDQYWDWTTAAGWYQGDHMSLSLGLEGATAPFEGEENPLELVARFGWDGEVFGFGGHLLSGLNDGSPDYGGGVFVFRDF